VAVNGKTKKGLPKGGEVQGPGRVEARKLKTSSLILTN